MYVCMYVNKSQKLTLQEHDHVHVHVYVHVGPGMTLPTLHDRHHLVLHHYLLTHSTIHLEWNLPDQPHYAPGQ